MMPVNLSAWLLTRQEIQITPHTLLTEKLFAIVIFNHLYHRLWIDIGQLSWNVKRMKSSSSFPSCYYFIFINRLIWKDICITYELNCDLYRLFLTCRPGVKMQMQMLQFRTSYDSVWNCCVQIETFASGLTCGYLENNLRFNMESLEMDWTFYESYLFIIL